MLNFSKGFLVEQIILATIILYEFGRFFENFSTISFLAGFSHSKKNIIWFGLIVTVDDKTYVVFVLWPLDSKNTHLAIRSICIYLFLNMVEFWNLIIRVGKTNNQ